MLYAHAGFYGRCVSRGLGVERPYVQLEAWRRLAQWNKCQKGEREGWLPAPGKGTEPRHLLTGTSQAVVGLQQTARLPSLAPFHFIGFKATLVQG